MFVEECPHRVPAFLHPTLAIAGAALVGLPILIHILMRRRRRPVEWGAMRFVIQAYQRQRRRLRFEQWLLLAARCLLVLLIGVALARPMLGSAAGVLGPRGPRTLYILLDNSLTSAVRHGASRSEFDISQIAARDALALLDAGRGDSAALIALGGPAESVVMPASNDLGAVRVALDALVPTNSAADVSGGLRAVRAALAATGAELTNQGLPPDVSVLALSSWRAGSLDTRRTSGETTPDAAPMPMLTASPTSETADNLWIADASPLRSVVIGARENRGASEAVRVTLGRSGPGVGREVSVRVRLSFASRSGKAAANIVTATFPAGQSRTEVAASVDVPAMGDDAFGLTLVAAIEDTLTSNGLPLGNAIAGDDVLRHPVPARSRLRVGLIAPASVPGRTAADFDGADWLTLALAPAGSDAPGADLRVTRLDPRALASAEVMSQDALLVPRPDALDDAAWALCRKAAESGALVLVTPPANSGAQLWTDAMAAGLGAPWKLGRDPRGYETPISLAKVESSSVASGASTQTSVAAGVLALLAGELGDLARPVTVTRVLEVQADDADVALRLADRSPLLVVSRVGSRGLVALLATAPELSWTTLPAMPLMVPLMQELVRQGVGQAAGDSRSLAGQPLALPNGVADLIALDEAAGGSAADAPRERLAPGGTPRYVGLYRAMDAAGQTRGLVAVNPDTQASRTDAQARADVMASLAALSAKVKWIGTGGTPELRPEDGPASPLAEALGDASDQRDRSWHGPALVLVLLLALVELALARFASHARILKPNALGTGLMTSTGQNATRTGDAA